MQKAPNVRPRSLSLSSAELVARSASAQKVHNALVRPLARYRLNLTSSESLSQSLIYVFAKMFYINVERSIDARASEMRSEIQLDRVRAESIGAKYSCKADQR